MMGDKPLEHPMNPNLKSKISAWHEAEEHEKIIAALEELPQEEWDYEVKNLLARAYNNVSNYPKALEILMSEKELSANDPLWNFRVGYGHYYNEEPHKALAFFQKSMALGDTDAGDFEQWCISDINAENQRVQQAVQGKPKGTLNNIAWNFSSKIYTDTEAFNADVRKYQEVIFKTAEDWKPNEIAFDFPQLQIQYEAWIGGPEDLLPNETLIDEDGTFEENNSDGGFFQVELVAKLIADNGKHFSALEFLFKTHNQMANKELGDHVFFEGTEAQLPIMEGLPICYISCGS
jgi:tetratricopeptide (TPR) repeat protein